MIPLPTRRSNSGHMGPIPMTDQLQQACTSTRAYIRVRCSCARVVTAMEMVVRDAGQRGTGASPDSKRHSIPYDCYCCHELRLNFPGARPASLVHDSVRYTEFEAVDCGHEGRAGTRPRLYSASTPSNSHPLETSSGTLVQTGPCTWLAQHPSLTECRQSVSSRHTWWPTSRGSW